ncbi:ATP-binding protein [Raoultella planticola]|uniref:ATP-binding protein n=1 Tax=Raoultella planticola TaxID=575 RepID=UPI0038910FE8
MVDINSSIRQVEINSGVSPDFIEKTLTQDITTLEALYDLVDNAIDAARNHILKGDFKKDTSGLPASYQGYKVHIRIDKDSVRIIDNCLGIDEETLTNTALYTAANSNHSYGIGYYGLGLKRALLKMGSIFSLAVDNGLSIFKCHFSSENIGGNKDKKIYANEYPSRNRLKSLFSVSRLKDEIKNDLHNSSWFENAVRGFSHRYSIYLSKGFEIIIHNVTTHSIEKIKGTIPTLRYDALLLPQREILNINGVEVTIESGIHGDYTFPKESNYSLSLNRTLTDQFGIYFVCNDRIIVAASTAKEHGWEAKWHSEYNGFVCWVRFISKEPNKLPWNTSKTALRVDSSLFLTVRDRLKPIADRYRAEIKNRYPSKAPSKSGTSPVTGRNPAQAPATTTVPVPPAPTATLPGTGSTKPKIKKPKLRPSEPLHRDREILVDWNLCSISVPQDREKEYGMFFELCKLSSKDVPITCAAMLRVFLETTVKQTSISLNVKWENLSKNTLSVAKQLCDQGYLEHVVKDLIGKYSTTDGGILSINNIQSLVHSVKFHPSQPLVNTYWSELEPFLSACWRFITEEDIKKKSDNTLAHGSNDNGV